MTRSYSQTTVIRAHRRVLHMVVDVIAYVPESMKHVLLTWGGGGLVTLAEVAEHAEMALGLKIKQATSKKRRQ